MLRLVLRLQKRVSLPSSRSLSIPQNSPGVIGFVMTFSSYFNLLSVKGRHLNDVSISLILYTMNVFLSAYLVTLSYVLALCLGVYILIN